MESQADAARLLCSRATPLVADARFARTARLTFTEWSAYFAKLFAVYLTGDTEIEQRP